MNQIGVFGAGGCGRSVMPIVRSQLESNASNYDLVFVDDCPRVDCLNGHEVITYSDWMKRDARRRQVVIAIADGYIRERLAERFRADGVKPFEVRAENVIQLDNVQVGEGSILCPSVILTSNITIGRHFHGNIQSIVEHDCKIGDYVTFGPGVRCNGNIIIEDHAYIGAGAILKQGLPDKPLIIGKGAIVGMGAVVTSNVSSGQTVVGNPARPLY